MAALGSTHSQHALFVTQAINRILRAGHSGRILTDDLVPTRERESVLCRLDLVTEAELDHVPSPKSMTLSAAAESVKLTALSEAC